MKVRLLYRDRDFDPQTSGPPNEAALIQDLELNTLFGAMAAGDEFLRDVARRVVLAGLDNVEAILYRQHVLADSLDYPTTVRELYSLSVDALQRERGIWGALSPRDPQGILHRSVQVLERCAPLLKRLRRIANENARVFHSEGFRNLFAAAVNELDDDFLGNIDAHLRRLEFRDGVFLSAGLDAGNKGTSHALHACGAKRNWLERLKDWACEKILPDHSGFVYRIDNRDDAGFRALGELRSHGIALVARALTQSTDHLLDFFIVLRRELGFYVGCLNLRDLLAGKGEPLCFPDLGTMEKTRLSARGLYDPCLSLTIVDRAVGNGVSADGKLLVMITGPNQGGKSTFLRSVGVAQLMLQCGTFVAAESFHANLCCHLYTHFKREEDAGMESGKLDEELARMSSIVDGLTPNSIVLFNESFASTNEREGSEIARQIVQALVERGIKVFYVTHLFDLAQGFHRAKFDAALFLRAERLTDGQRTFRLVEGEPLATSHAEDLYRRIFGAVPVRRREWSAP